MAIEAIHMVRSWSLLSVVWDFILLLRLLHCGIESMYCLSLTLLDRMSMAKHFEPVRHVYVFYASRYWYRRELFWLRHRMPMINLCGFACENRIKGTLLKLLKRNKNKYDKKKKSAITQHEKSANTSHSIHVCTITWC